MIYKLKFYFLNKKDLRQSKEELTQLEATGRTCARLEILFLTASSTGTSCRYSQAGALEIK